MQTRALCMGIMNYCLNQKYERLKKLRDWLSYMKIVIESERIRLLSGNLYTNDTEKGDSQF